MCVVTAAEDEPSDHNIAAGLDQTTCADVSQLGVDRLAGVVDFHQTYAGAAVFSGQDGSIGSAGIKRGDETRLVRIMECKSQGGKLGRVRRVVLPVVVLHEQRAVGRAQLKGRIGQRVTDAETRKRWSNSSHRHGLGCVPRDNESANKHVVAAFNPEPGRNV